MATRDSAVTASPTSPGVLTRRGSLRRSRACAVVRPPHREPVSVLATATGTKKIVFESVKAAHGWTDATKLTKDEFVRMRDEWLTKPAREVRR